MLRAETFNWEMDLFALSSLSNSRPLTAITYNAFKVSPQKQAEATSTEIVKKAWLFAKLQPGRARKRINAT